RHTRFDCDWSSDVCSSDLACSAAMARTLAEQALTTLFVVRDEQMIGLIALADTLRADADQAIRRLEAVGVKQTIMLTGDIHESRSEERRVGKEWRCGVGPA